MDLLKYISSITVISGAFVFIIQSLTKFLLNRNIEKYKDDIKRTSLEHQIIFSKLHENRAIVIKETYTKLVRMERSMLDLVGYMSTKHAETAKNSVLDLKFYFEENQIYFDNKIATLLGEIINITHNSYFEASYNHPYQLSEINNDKIKEETIKARMLGWEKVKKNVPPLKHTLEEEFRKLLGVNSSTSTVE